jgi:hypothetical protein
VEVFSIKNAIATTLFIFTVATACPAGAGTDVKVGFSGTCVTGSFNFDQSKGPTTPPVASGNFQFGTAPTPAHGICTQVIGASSMDCPMNFAEFTITTSMGMAGAKAFKLVAKYTGVGGAATEVDITLTTLVLVNGASLPLCGAFCSGTTCASGTFKKTVGTAAPITCNINVTSCSPPQVVGLGPPGGHHPWPEPRATGQESERLLTSFFPPPVPTKSLPPVPPKSLPPASGPAPTTGN